MVSPEPGALRAPPASKEPPLADVTALGAKQPLAVLGMGDRALPAFGSRARKSIGAPAWPPVLLQPPQCRERSLFLPRDQIKARRARPGEAHAALSPESQPSCCPCPEVPRGTNPKSRPAEGPWHRCCPCSVRVPGQPRLQGSVLRFLPQPQPWGGSSLLQIPHTPGTDIWNKKSALAAAAGFSKPRG